MIHKEVLELLLADAIVSVNNKPHQIISLRKDNVEVMNKLNNEILFVGYSKIKKSSPALISNNSLKIFEQSQIRDYMFIDKGNGVLNVFYIDEVRNCLVNINGDIQYNSNNKVRINDSNYNLRELFIINENLIKEFNIDDIETLINAFKNSDRSGIYNLVSNKFNNLIFWNDYSFYGIFNYIDRSLNFYLLREYSTNIHEDTELDNESRERIISSACELSDEIIKYRFRGTEIQNDEGNYPSEIQDIFNNYYDRYVSICHTLIKKK